MQTEIKTKYRKSLSSHNEVAHIWAQRSQPEGKSGNMFFEGDSIWSYGKHFKIAQFIENKGQTYVLFNSHNYSISTSKHKSLVHRAANHFNSFTIPELPYYDNMTLVDHEENMRYYMRNAEENIEKSARARKYPEFDLNRAVSYIDEMNKYATFFDIELNTEQKELVRRMNDGSLLNEEQKAAIKQKDQERRKAAIEKNKKEIAEWIEGIGYSIPSSVDKIFLRRKGDNVETSHGAVVPALEARVLYRSIKGGKDVRGAQIGYYTVREFTGKVLKVGCHKLEISEIDRFAETQNW